MYCFEINPLFLSNVFENPLVWFAISGCCAVLSIVTYKINKADDQRKKADEEEKKRAEHARWEKMTPEERELELKWSERQMKESQKLNSQISSAIQGGLSFAYIKSLNHEMEELKKEGERWKTLSIEEKRREMGILSKTTQTSSPLNMRLEFNLPRTCPKCNQLVNWKYVDSEKTETLDSAYRVMGSTTVFTKEKITRRFICDKCGFEMKR